jgi:hypothetical protein
VFQSCGFDSLCRLTEQWNDPPDGEEQWLLTPCIVLHATGLTSCDMAKRRKGNNATAATSAQIKVAPCCWTIPILAHPRLRLQALLEPFGLTRSETPSARHAIV